MALQEAADDKQQFTMHVVVDTHKRFMELSVVYTNNLVWVEHSIHIMESLLVEEKFKGVRIDLDYTCPRSGSRPKSVVAQTYVRNHVLVYLYCLNTRPCEHFDRFVNSPHYMFAMVDITNDVKMLKNSGITYKNLVDIQGQYKTWGSKKDEKDSLVYLAEAIIDPYYRYMKDSCNKDKCVWHSAWMERLDKAHVVYAAKEAYTSYKIYTRIVNMRKCLLPQNGQGSCRK
ncbi:hypothetical protein D1007_54782 [Hordeum vulgare]|nr:hypothetical protein D1007_54782 [Hordeum vulgare]